MLNNIANVPQLPLLCHTPSWARYPSEKGRSHQKKFEVGLLVMSRALAAWSVGLTGHRCTLVLPVCAPSVLAGVASGQVPGDRRAVGR